MSEYVLPHLAPSILGSEPHRLDLMSALLDPVARAHLAQMGVRPGWRCLEFGYGNGSIAHTLAQYVAPVGNVVASDIDLRYIEHLQASG